MEIEWMIETEKNAECVKRKRKPILLGTDSQAQEKRYRTAEWLQPSHSAVWSRRQTMWNRWKH
jgi:hypothetical protein